MQKKTDFKIPKADIIKRARAKERRQRQRKKISPPSAFKLKCKCFSFFFFVIIICLILFIPHATPTLSPSNPTQPPPPPRLLHPFVSKLVKQSARAANYVFKWKRLVNVALGRGKMIGRGWWNWNECWGVVRSLTRSGGGGCGGGGRGSGASGTSRAHPGRCHLPGGDWKAGWGERERMRERGGAWGAKGVGVR